MRALPIDAILEDILSSLSRIPCLVLEAAPGAGKTTRVPAALLDTGLLCAPEVLVLQPRRLAARMAARFVAAEAGEKPGGLVGYQVRFDEKIGPTTRLKFITEALLLRRMQSDRRLERVGAVILDEFHERHLATDVGLAMLQRLRQGARPDLKLVVMSATLDAAPVADYLDCPALSSEGRQFPVKIEHARRLDDRPLEQQVASAVARLVREESDGDILVFLPGARQIRRAAEACESLAREQDLILAPLYGDLSPAEQDRAVKPTNRRKVILSTNVAETSVTIDGVVAVVDSGLARIAGHDPWSGMSTLKLRPISRASAAQRAGRAGRTRPGRCLRLYTEQDHATRRDHEAPEIRRLDLAGSVLLLAALGVDDPTTLDWLEPPAEAALAAAQDLLGRLGAVDGAGRITESGRYMAALPLHPRQARIVLEAQRRGRLADGAAIAAVLGERELRVEPREGQQVGSSDLLQLAGALGDAERARFNTRRSEATTLRPGRARAAVRARDQIVRLARQLGPTTAPGQGGDEALLVAILAGYPDRVARRRPAGGRRRGDAELLLALGGTALLAESSVVRDDEWLVAVEAEQGEHASGRPLVRRASAVNPAWLLDLFLDRIEQRDEMDWNEKAERVERVSRMTYENLVLDESRVPAGPTGEAVALLREQALAAGPTAFADEDALRLLRARVATVRNVAPEARIRALDDDLVLEVLAEMCDSRCSFAEVREASLLELLRGRLGTGAYRLDELAPSLVALPGGRRLKVKYELDKLPWVESMLQDFFGMQRGPAVAGGRVPLTLHLLAPNRRAVQVTTDLAGFWQNHYPALRRSLSRRYPRHAWPEDPVAAEPPPPGGRRRR